MKVKAFLITLVLFSMFFNCASPVRTVIMPEYKNDGHLQGSTLGIMVDSTNIKIMNKSSFFDDFGKGKPDTMFINILKLALPQAGNKYTSFQHIYFIPHQNEAFSEQKTFEFPSKDTISIHFPVDGMIIKSDSIRPDLVLLLQNVLTRELYSSSYNPVTHTSSGSRNLAIYSKYVLWDNRQGKLVSFGDAVGITTVFFGMTPDTWYKAIYDMMKKIFKNKLLSQK